MPGLSGIRLAMKIKEVKKDVKVIIMSAFEIKDDSELKEIQLKEFLQKPFHLQKLVSMVENIMNSAQIETRVD